MHWERKVYSGLLVLLIVWAKVASGAEFKLIPSVALKQEYNTNLFLSEQDKEEDFISTISPGLELERRTERSNVSFQSRVNRLLYGENDELNAWDYSHNGNIRYQLTPRMRVSTEARFTRDSRPDQDLEITGLVLSAQPSYRQHYFLSGDYALSEKTAAALSYAFDRDEYDDPELSDIRYNTVNLGITRDIQNLISSTIGRMNLGYARYTLTDSTVENYTWTIGAKRELSETFSLLLDFGTRYTISTFEVSRLVFIPPFFFQFVTEEQKNRGWGTVGQIVLTYQGEYTQGNLTFYRDVRAAGGRYGTTERTAVVFEMGRRFKEFLRGTLSGGYYANQSEEQEFSTGKIDEETFWINPQIRYDFTENLTIEAHYRFTRLKNNERDIEADRNLFFIRFRFAHSLFE